jgi:hypothetical protein
MWDRAKPSRIPEEVRPVWMGFDDDWVEEVKRGLKACNVFLFYPFLCMLPVLRVIEKYGLTKQLQGSRSFRCFTTSLVKQLR